MALSAQAAGVIQAMGELGVPDFADCDVPTARAVAEGFIQMQRPGADVADVVDVLIPGPGGDIPARVYVGQNCANGPVIMYFHGGGWVVGNLGIVDQPCRDLANANAAVVVSVDYRLAPEHKFPAAPEDCYAATTWAAEHAAEFGGDASKLVVCGDSAGGNLSAVVSIMARDNGGPQIAAQWLIYPVTDAAPGTPFASYVENASDYTLTAASMNWFWEHYTSTEADNANPLAAPLKAPSLAGLPPAFVAVAQYDPLRDEGIAFAEALKGAGGAVVLKNYDDQPHGFFWMSGAISEGYDALLADMTAHGKDVL